MEYQKPFLNPLLTVDIIIFTVENNTLRILLTKRKDEPFRDVWALPGGFLLQGETTETGAKRILKEKAGVEKVYTEQLYTFDTPGRDPRGPVFTVTYFALVPRNELLFKPVEASQSTEFVDIRKMPKLAFDHKEIIAYAIKRIQAKLQYTNIIFSLLPKNFSLFQLQKTYETILDKKLDKRNFQKKFLQLDLIKTTGKMLTGAKQRPAKLYTFKSKKPAELKKFF
jgi:8-oxo-dGTP diphosphatase